MTNSWYSVDSGLHTCVLHSFLLLGRHAYLTNSRGVDAAANSNPALRLSRVPSDCKEFPLSCREMDAQRIFWKVCDQRISDVITGPGKSTAYLFKDQTPCCNETLVKNRGDANTSQHTCSQFGVESLYLTLTVPAFNYIHTNVRIKSFHSYDTSVTTLDTMSCMM